MSPRRKTSRILAALTALTLAACGADRGDRIAEDARPELGLFTTLPVYWPEAPTITAVLDADVEPHWARQLLERTYQLVPLDTLSEKALAGIDRVLIAQPRPFAPAENVALDDWVRAGGRALILADPMLAQHSIYPIGDKRRAQDVVLISPILARWGLALQYDEAQPEGRRLIEEGGAAIPVERAGSLVATGTGHESECEISHDGLIATCRIGAGWVKIVADADVLDSEPEGEAIRAFGALAETAFPGIR